MIFRLSQKLNVKIKAGPLETLPLNENPYADWSAHLFPADRTQYVLLTNTKSLYSVVMVGKGITLSSLFVERAVSNIREFIEAEGHEFVYRRFIASATASIRFAKALDRSVTGAMNDLVKQATYLLATGEFSLFDVGSRLNKTPMSALGFEKPLFGMPMNAFKAMVDDSYDGEGRFDAQGDRA